MTKHLAAALLAALAALAACDSPSDPLASDDIERAARDMASVAGAGVLLVGEIRQGHLGANYAWVQAQALQDETRKASEPLQKPVPPPLRQRREAVAAVAGRLATHLGQVGFAMEDDAALLRLAHEFDVVQAQANAMKGDKK